MVDMRSLTSDDKRWGCEEEGCDVHPDRGGAVYRTSPKGEPWRGRCKAQLDARWPVAAELQDVVDTLQSTARPP